MKVIVGLGNPGEEHKDNRHNVGFVVIDRLMENGQWKIDNKKWEKKFEAEVVKIGEVLLVKPQTFMNNSGKVVSKIVNFYKVNLKDLWVVHDDLDIVLGEYKVQFGRGPKIHNGVSSVEEHLGSKEFGRIRVGVDNRLSGEGRSPGDEYVLDDFRKEEKEVIAGVIEKISKQLNETI